MTAKKTPVPTPPTAKRLGVRSLRSAEDVSKLLAKLVKARLANDIDDAALRTITQASIVLLKAFDAGQVNKRIDEIEKLLLEWETNK